MPEELEGSLESLTYHNEETGYTVARLRPNGREEPVTVVGTLTAPAPGQSLRLTGEWQTHARFGRQFRFQSSQSASPATAEGIERYLGSGLIKGIGPELSRRIVARFGAEALRVIEQEPRRLKEVPGIGEHRLASLNEAWESQRGVREVMLFLQSHGVGPAHAYRIYRQYGTQAVQTVRSDPYRLAGEVYGIGFRTADRIAGELGIARDAPQRIAAGLLHVLQDASSEGHTYLPRAELLRRSAALLELEAASLEPLLAALEAGGRLVREGEGTWLPLFQTAESGAALLLGRLASAPRALRLPFADPATALAEAQAALGLELAAAQRRAVEAALREKVLVITGGPGTGKTTIMRALVALLSRAGARTLLAAPTGRAAKRLQEASRGEARTIHRLLEFDHRTGGFRKGPSDPLSCDFLIVDEASMVDTLLLYQLLRALPDSAGLVLLGDVDQLPSVGAGSVLRDIIASGRFPVVELTEVFRQAAASRIVTNAHLIRAGRPPVPEEREGAGDFFFIEQSSPGRVAEIILQLVTTRIPRRFGLDPHEDIQVLSPMHKGEAGVENLNRLLQAALNPGMDALERGARRFAAGDRVLQLRNNYEKEVFNGDIGRIRRLDRAEQELEVVFDGRPVRYDFAELDELALAYAVSVHKAQGGEYPAVVIPVLTQHYVLLQRNLLYTAVTRGRRLVVLVGTRRALHIALRDTGAGNRYTRLRERLQEVR